VLAFWRFATNVRFGKDLRLDCPVFKMELHRPSSLLAVALSDFSVDVVDIVGRKVVRKFDGHDQQLTDIAFSPDARWIVTASLDSVLKVWDMPTGDRLHSQNLNTYVYLVSFVSLTINYTFTVEHSQKYRGRNAIKVVCVWK
jgi:U3 small nucleolar RNA-associated protein 21